MEQTQEAAAGGVWREQRVESMGWLTESSIMPKKQKVIEGVGASSIIQLRAQLYQTQADVQRMRDGDPTVEKHRSRKKNDVFGRQNAGVQERERRDKLELKATTDGSASYAALEKKAEIYDKIMRGEIPDEEDKEKYSVDFLRKGFLDEEAEEIEREKKRDSVSNDEPSTSEFHPSSSPVTAASHRDLVREVNRETKVEREKTSILKQRRQQQAEERREKLRQAFLRKQLEKIKKGATEGAAEEKAKNEEECNT